MVKLIVVAVLVAVMVLVQNASAQDPCNAACKLGSPAKCKQCHDEQRGKRQHTMCSTVCRLGTIEECQECQKGNVVITHSKRDAEAVMMEASQRLREARKAGPPGCKPGCCTKSC